MKGVRMRRVRRRRVWRTGVRRGGYNIKAGNNCAFNPCTTLFVDLETVGFKHQTHKLMAFKITVVKYIPGLIYWALAQGVDKTSGFN